MKTNLKKVYGLQGGGLGIFDGPVLIFVEVPDFMKETTPKYDPVPKDWSFVEAPNLVYDSECMEVFEKEKWGEYNTLFSMGNY